MNSPSDTQAKAPEGPYTLRSRLEDPVTSSVEIGLDAHKWGIAISTPCPPFAFGEIAAVICTARSDAEQIAVLFAAAPDLLAALKAAAIWTEPAAGDCQKKKEAHAAVLAALEKAGC